MILILLRVDGLDHEMEVRILRVVQKTEERVKRRKLVRKMRKRLMEMRRIMKMRRMMKMIKKWRTVLMENGKVIMITMEALDTEAKMSTKKTAGLITSALL